MSTNRLRSMQRAATEPADAQRARARDVALRRTRGVIAGVAAGAVGFSGAFSVVAAHAFKGHAQHATASTSVRRPRARRIHVPGPQAVPGIASTAPLQPPADPPGAAPAPTAAPAAPAPAPTTAPAPAPPPQVSGGS